MKNEVIVLKGQKYAVPRTESVVVVNQGVLCASSTISKSNITLQVNEGFLS